jgi:Amt family ammonium transporter
VDTSSVVTGLFYGGGVAQLWIQAYGTITVALAVFVVSMGLMYAVKATGALRVSQAGELEGLDIHEHGAPAYPEFATSFASAVAAAASQNGSAGTPTPTPTVTGGGVAVSAH